MIPLVTVSWRPNGLLIAITPSPTWTLDESPSVSGCRTDDGTSIRTTARSVELSEPTRCALYDFPFQSLTVIDVAPSTTCWFVMMSPRLSKTNPEPSAWLEPPPPPPNG